MIILAFDFETSGLDKQKDRIIEIGLALYSTGQRRVLDSVGFLVNPDGITVAEEITAITGIYQSAVETFGFSEEAALDAFFEMYNKSEAIIGHNILRFDLPVLHNAMDRLGYDRLEPKLAIDTMTDIPDVKGEQLVTMCAKAGFLYDAHSALDDAKAVLKLIERYQPFDGIVERAKSPTVVLRSLQNNTTENNKVARKAGFRWNGDFKIWWQSVKEMDVEKLAKSYPFAMEYVSKDITLEQLRDEK